MKQNKTVLAAIVAIVLIAVLLLSIMTVGIFFSSGNLNPRGDWSYALENGYEVWRINSKETVVCWKESPEKTSASTVIESYVSEIAVSDGWLCAKQLNTPNDTETRYYLLDMGAKKLYGPYETEKSFEEERKSLGVICNLTWIRTKDEIKNWE